MKKIGLLNCIPLSFLNLVQDKNMYLSEFEEIIAFIVCGLILVAFGVSTYQNIKTTIAEEKEKEAEKKENEEKVKVLIKYFKAKTALLKKIEQIKKQSGK
ncbi:MAG: hypothetical protein ACPGVF_00030 [Flavobacteriaceae bacterium]